MECPRDHTALVIRHHHDLAYEGCETCGGYFLAHGLLRESLALHQEPAPGRVDYAALPPGGLRCPVDQTQMRALVHHGVEIDLCPACEGVWLDGGEFEAIVQHQRKRHDNDDTGADIDLGGGSSDSGSEVDAVDGGDAGDVLDSVVEFIGDALGSLFDGF